MVTERPTPSRKYAYVSIAQLSKFLDVLTKIRPDVITPQFLVTYGIPEGSTHAVISALKFLGIINDDGKPASSRLLIRLGNQQERSAALREIVDASYADLLSQQNIETATVDDLNLYFQYQDMSPNVSIKAARLFMWLAQQAGYLVGEPVQPQIRTQTRPTSPSRRENNRPVQPESHIAGEPPDSFLSADQDQPMQPSFNKYEEELLQILLANLKASGQLPDTELLKELQKLIASVKGQRPPDSG